MKIKKWYDICCDCCTRRRSTDFGWDVEHNKKGLAKKARQEGWRTYKGSNICPICVKNLEDKGVNKEK